MRDELIRDITNSVTRQIFAGTDTTIGTHDDTLLADTEIVVHTRAATSATTDITRVELAIGQYTEAAVAHFKMKTVVTLLLLALSQP